MVYGPLDRKSVRLWFMVLKKRKFTVYMFDDEKIVNLLVIYYKPPRFALRLLEKLVRKISGTFAGKITDNFTEK
jgi:hypothetical protein